MGQTNITNNTNQPIETPLINPTTSKSNNIYKYLFLVTLVILFGVIIYFYTNTNNKNSQPLSNDTTEEIIEATPIEIVEEINNENHEEQGNTDTKKQYKAISVDDDKNSITKLILIDQNNNETVIDQEKYWYMAEHTMKVGYWDFVFSPDNNYLYYIRGAISFLYDLKNKKAISLGISADTKGFSPDSKYFYACAESGMVSGGAIIKGLNSLNNIFLSNDESDSYECQYSKDVRELLLSKTTEPGLVSGEKILSQYKFSEKTGVLTKIK